MSIKTKHEDSDQQSLIARFQQFIGHGKSRQLEINASPSECLNWIASFKGNPESREASVETQPIKRPYQFTAHISSRGYRGRMDFGVVGGDIVQSPTSESKSIVTLHFYHTLGSVWTVVILGILCFGMGIAMLLSSLDIITHPTSMRFPVEAVLCFGGVGAFFIGAGIFGIVKLLGGHQPLDMVSAHLLKLNSEQETPPLT